MAGVSLDLTRPRVYRPAMQPRSNRFLRDLAWVALLAAGVAAAVAIALRWPDQVLLGVDDQSSSILVGLLTAAPAAAFATRYGPSPFGWRLPVWFSAFALWAPAAWGVLWLGSGTDLGFAAWLRAIADDLVVVETHRFLGVETSSKELVGGGSEYLWQIAFGFVVSSGLVTLAPLLRWRCTRCGTPIVRKAIGWVPLDPDMPTLEAGNALLALVVQDPDCRLHPPSHRGSPPRVFVFPLRCDWCGHTSVAAHVSGMRSGKPMQLRARPVTPEALSELEHRAPAERGETSP
jgi:hypothetical protein